jgi:hypothetical protein
LKRQLIVAGLALTLGACAEKPDDTGHAIDDALAMISQENISAHLEYLASDDLEGRMTGEPGHEAAAAYVAEQFAALGLEPGGTDGWYQSVPLQSYALDTSEGPTLTIHRDSGDTELRFGEDFMMGADKVRAATTVSGELVFVSFGVHAPEFGYSDLDGVDLNGKIAVSIFGGPAIIPSDELAHYSDNVTKNRELALRGAVGTLVLYPREMEESYPYKKLADSYNTQPGMAWVDESGAASDYFPGLLGRAWLSPAAANDLLDGSPISFDAARDATEASKPASTALGIEITLSRKSTHDALNSPNVIGILRGSDPELADEYVVYTAHLDHVGRGNAVEGDDIYNGMYDNAMGTALMIETARALAAAPPRRSVMFIALTGEELGLLGSDYFARYPTVPVESIVANVNIDMPVLIFPVADLIAFGAEHSSLDLVASAAATAEGFVLVPDPQPEEHFFVRSDQYSFVQQGIPAIYIDPGYGSTDPGIDGEALKTEFERSHYHEPSDDMSRPIDWPSAIRFTRANARIGWGIANDDARPTWNEGDFFGDKFAPQ